MLRKLLIAPVLIFLAGCGVTSVGKPEIDGQKVLVQKVDSIKGAPEYYIVNVYKVPLKRQKSVALEAIKTVDSCEVDKKTLRFLDLGSRTLGTDELTPTVPAAYIYVSTMCQQAVIWGKEV